MIAPETVKVAAHLYNPATGERGVDVGEYPVQPWDLAEDGGTAYFMWTEGNYSCDCNRRLFLWYALHPGETEEPDFECGEGAILVEKLVVVGSGCVIAENI